MIPRSPSRRDALALGAAGLLLPLQPARADIAPARSGARINTWPWFSLTTEYPVPRRDYAWPPVQETRAVPKRAGLARLAAAGFDFIRIPVDPGPFLADASQRQALLLATLIEAVTAVHGAGLGLIVTIQTNEATHCWNARNLIASVDAPKFGAYRA